MRSEFIGDCARFRDLPEAVTGSPYLIPWMTREQRRLAIEEPVRVAQGKISQRLVARILNDGGESPDQLPVMQHALMRTWDYWQANHQPGEEIDLDHYIQVGGIANALSLHADLTFDQLPGARLQFVAKRIFQSLTERLSESRDVRRPLTIARLMQETDCTFDEVVAVMEQFRQPGCSFLMPPRDIKLERDTVVDISHESLIRGWRRLADWVQGEHESAAFYRRMAEWAADHAKGKAALWQDPDLQNALEWRNTQKPNAAWAQRYNPGFDQAMAFLDQSRKAALAAQEAEQLRKAEEEKRKAEELRRTRAHLKVVGVVCILALVALAGAVYYGLQYQKTSKTAKSQAAAIKDTESLWLEYSRESVSELYALPDLPDDPESVKQVRESFLKKTFTVSERVLNDDPKNREAQMLSALSASLLAKLHAETVGRDPDKRQQLDRECENNIKRAMSYRENHQEHNLVISALLLGSSATIFENDHRYEEARRLAFQAISDVQEASRSINLDDPHLWNWALRSYKAAKEILDKDFLASRNEDTTGHSELANDLAILKAIRHEPHIGVENEVALLDDIPRGKAGTSIQTHKTTPGTDVKIEFLDLERKVATLEQDLKMPDKALETYETGAQLARKMVAQGKTADELLNSAFWVFARMGTAYQSKEKFDQAQSAMEEARQIQSRFTSHSEQAQYDRLAIFSFLGGLHRSKSSKLESNHQSGQQELRAALDADKEGLSCAMTYTGAKGTDYYALLAYLHENVIADYVASKDYSNVEQIFQGWLTFLANTPKLAKPVSDGLFSLSFIRTAHLFQDAGDYTESLKWIDRHLKSLDQRHLSRGERNILLSRVYGQRSWLDLLTGDFEGAVSDAQRGFKLDSSQIWILTNEAHGFLFAGKFDRAWQIYRANWGKKTNNNGDEKFGEAVQDDFKEFRRKPNPKMNLDYLSKMEASLAGLKSQTGNEAH